MSFKSFILVILLVIIICTGLYVLTYRSEVELTATGASWKYVEQIEENPNIESKGKNPYFCDGSCEPATIPWLLANQFGWKYQSTAFQAGFGPDAIDPADNLDLKDNQRVSSKKFEGVIDFTDQWENQYHYKTNNDGEFRLLTSNINGTHDLCYVTWTPVKCIILAEVDLFGNVTDAQYPMPQHH